VEDIVENCNNNEIETLVSENTGLIWSIVNRFKNRGYEVEDLYQIGAIGLIKAIKKFDESYGVKLSTYAVPYIIGEIKIFLRDDGIVKVSRSLKELNYKIKMLENKYESENKKITIEEMEKELKVQREDIILAQNLSNNVESINEASFENGDNEKEERILINKNDNQEKDIIEKIMLKDALKNLEEREREIIILRYFKENTQSEVAKKYGMSQVQISRIERKILEKMRKDIKEII